MESHIDELKELKDTIRRLHGVDSSHVETVAAEESFEGETIWEGEVEVFELYDHPETDKLYAWVTKIYDIDNPERHVTVLHICPLTSPQLAVRAAVIQEYRNVKDPKKTKKVGRPKLPKDHTHARTIIVQVKDDDWKLFSKAAKANKLTNWPSSYPPREHHQSGHDGNQQGQIRRFPNKYFADVSL